MKVALLLALAATVAAVSSYTPTVHSVIFRPGEQYVYHYKGHVLSGIPKSTSQFAGLLIDSIVVLQFQQDYKVVMKLEKVKLYKINNKISTLPSEPLQESDVTRLTTEQAVVITEYLVKPLKFRYEEGEVRELETEVEDRFWSVNIKKGILSIFQVTLKEKNSMSSVDSSSYYPDPTMTKIRSLNPRFNPMTPYWKQTSKSNSVYKVMETDVTGNCETKYTVISDKTQVSSSGSKMYVTAVRNYENCLNKPFHIQGLFQGVYRHSAEKDLMQPIVHYDYVITGDRTQFLIKEATTRGKYFFLINGLEGGDMSSFIHQKLTLQTTEPIRSPIRLISPKTDTRGLLMVIPKSTLLPERKSYESEMDRSSSYERRREYQNIKEFENEEDEEKFIGETGDIISVVEQKLSELVHCLYPVTEERCSVRLLHITRILRQANKGQLKSIISRYLSRETSSETEYRKSEIILDILPTLPSPDAGKVLIELIRERKISEIRGSLMVKVMSLMVKPTPTVIKSVLELFKELPKESSTRLNYKTVLRQSLLLSVGTLTHRLINVMRSHGKPIPEVITFIDSVSGELKRMLEETTSETEKILILKSMGNMGASETIMILKSVAEDTRLPNKVRISAIFGLRRLAKQFNKQVVPILMSFFMDVKEHTELRQAAFVVIINSNPSFPSLQMLAHRIRHEPSSQIRTLVYSSLVNLALYSSHEPEHKILSRNARLILKSIPAVKVGIHDTMSVLINKFSEEFDLGGAINVMKIKSKMSGLPEALIANLQGTLFGKHRRLLEVGAEGKSLEVILRKIFGPHGLLKEILKGQISLRDLFNPLTRTNMGGVQEKVREVLSKMMIELRSEEHPFSTWYIHVLGNELQYIILNSENVEDIVNKVTNIIPELIMRLTRGIKVDVIKSLTNIASLTIASPIGIPLSLNCTTMAIFKVDGHIKVNNLPTWSDIMVNKYSNPIPRITLDVDLKPVIDVHHDILVGADMRWLTTAVGTQAEVRATFPVKLSVHVDGPEHTLSVKLFTPKETIKTLHANITPMTVIKYIPTTVSKLPYTMEPKEIKNEEIVKMVPFETRYKCSVSGKEIETRGVYSLCGPTWCPIFPLFGRQEIEIVMRPVTPVDFVLIKIKSLKTNFQYEGVPASMVTDELYGEDTEYDETEPENRYRQQGGNYRTSSRLMIESGDFEPITPDPIFRGEPIKRQILITLGPNNQQSPKIKSMITWFMGQRYWKHQINVQVIRLAHQETPIFKLNLNHVMNTEVWYPEEQYRGESGEFLAKVHLKWNIYGFEKEIKGKIIPGSPFDFTRELREHSILTTDNLPVANVQKYKYTLEVELPQMSHRTLKYVTIAHDAVKVFFYRRLTTTIPLNPHSEKIIVAVEVLPWWEQMNIIVKTPREDSYITGVPFYWNPFLPTNEKIKLHDLPAWKWYNSTEEEDFSEDTVPYRNSPVLGNKCYYSETTEKITTFDGVRLPVSPLEKYSKRSCSFVLSQHCSNEGLFSIVKTGDIDTELKIKVIVPKYEIEWIGRPYKMELLINGEMKTLPTGQPLIIRDENSESSPKLYKLEMIDNLVSELTAYELGFTLIVNKQDRTIMLKLSPFSMLQGQLCGLCGNYNQDQSDDFNTQSDFQVENRDFYGIIKNSLIRSDTCDYDKINPINDDYCMKESHLTIRRFESEPLTCTSERKIPQCSEGCRPERTTSLKTCFTCRTESGLSQPRKSYIPSRWDVEEGSSIECEDFFQRVEVPTRCVPVY